MTILVTGGAGYIGSHTCVELLQKGYDVVVVDNFDNSSPKSLQRVKEITGKAVTLYEGDIRDGALLDKIFAKHAVDWVIHFAGLKAVGESCAKPIEYYNNNLYGTLVLIDAMRKHGCKKIVFSSSATVYGDPEVLPLREDCKTGGTTNPYGTSNNLTPYIAKVAIGELKEVGVFGNDYATHDGTGVRDYIHVVDLAQGHVAAIEKVTDTGVHVYNLGTGIGYSVLDVIHAFEKACGHKLPYSIKPRRAGDIARLFGGAFPLRNFLRVLRRICAPIVRIDAYR